MKRSVMFLLLLLLSSAMGTPVLCWAATYYVSPIGSMTNSGSLTSPWRTVNKALSSVSSGDTINVASGVYTEFLGVTSSVTLCGADLYDPSKAPFLRSESRTIICAPQTDRVSGAVVHIMAPGVALRNMTFDGDADNNGIADVKFGIYSTNRPVTVDGCTIRNIRGYGICALGHSPSPKASDNDSLRVYITCNTITNITHTNTETATGIFLQESPMTCSGNSICAVSGATCRAGIFVESCYFTTNMSGWAALDGNTIDRCPTAIWANRFGSDWEKLILDNNRITNAAVGIRVSAARGQALIHYNRIYASGLLPTASSTPARAIWLQGDVDPWRLDEKNKTDHSVIGNLILGGATNADGSVGMAFDYDNTPSGDNNGMRATATYNLVTRFDYGIRVRSGIHGITITNDPLVEVILNCNDISNNVSYGVFSEGVTNYLDATNNWWGLASGPAVPPANPPGTNITSVPFSAEPFTTDTDSDELFDVFDTDDDNDRALDWAELVAGTDPSNSVSVFIVKDMFSVSSNTVSISWNSVSNRKYNVYLNTNSAAIAWTFLTNVNSTPPTNTLQHSVSGNWSRRFYRITATN